MSSGPGGRPLGFIAGLGYERMAAASVVESLLEAGYDGVEWTMAHENELLPPSLALACQQDLVGGGDEALSTTLRAIDSAAAAGIPVVNVLTGPNLWEQGAQARDDEEAWQVALQSLSAACEHAAALGVTLGFEPCWGTLAHDADTTRRVLDEVPVSVTFDPSHFVIEGEDVPALVREWGERIVHVHLKDAFGRPGIEGEDFIFCLLGEGKVPWRRFFDALDEVGFEGACSVEFEAYAYYEQVLGADPGAAARLAARQVSALCGERR